jgi:hypothetical protein
MKAPLLIYLMLISGSVRNRLLQRKPTTEPVQEKMYEYEVKKLFMRAGGKRLGWVIATVADAIRDGATEYRCKDCHGAVKLHGKHVQHGPAPHVEHKSRQDSEYCPAGMYFRHHARPGSAGVCLACRVNTDCNRPFGVSRSPLQEPRKNCLPANPRGCHQTRHMPRFA